MNAPPRRESTSYELYLDLLAIDKRFAADFDEVMHKLTGRIRGKLS